MHKSDELTTEEALDLCDQLIEMDVEHVNFTGGEPYMREDWPLLAKKLCDAGIDLTIISNGWFIDKKIIQTALDLGMSNMAVSLDGSEKVHDDLRIKGSFQRVMNALDLMREMGMPSLICTSINSRNLNELRYLKNLLIDKGVERWQLQIIEPTGNALDHEELLLVPGDLEQIVDFAYETMREGKIVINLVDNIGYYDIKSTDIRRACPGEPKTDGVWRGCEGGKSAIGIRCNGDITPCACIRDDSFIEGNIRDTSLREIWTRPEAFAWNRNMVREDLKGFCRKCQFGDLCLGGCTSLKITLSKTLYDNKYCIYRNEFERQSRTIDGLSELDELISKGKDLMDSHQYEAAEVCFTKVTQLHPDCKKAVELLNQVKNAMEDFA